MKNKFPPTWSPKKLDELGFVGRGKSKHRPRNDPILYSGEYPFFQTSDVKNANLYLKEYSQTYNDTGLAQSKLWEPGTLLITIAANIAETAILSVKGCFPDSIVGFVADPAKVDVRYLKYYIDYIKIHMQNISRGTTQDNLSLSKLLIFDFFVPDILYQKKVADILSQYDELFELNMRRIELLEDFAQDVYSKWFVHLRYTGHQSTKIVKTPRGPTPEGWTWKKVKDISVFQKGKKPKTVYQNEKEGTIPHILIEVLRGGEVAYTDDLSVTAEKDDTIMVMDGASSGDVYIGYEGSVGSTLGYYKNLDKESVSPYLLYHFFKANHTLIIRNNVGSAIPHANKDFISQMELLIPTQNIHRKFDDLMKRIHREISLLKEENLRLRRMRDLLLPRLVSGKIDVAKLNVDGD